MSTMPAPLAQSPGMGSELLMHHTFFALSSSLSVNRHVPTSTGAVDGPLFTLVVVSVLMRCQMPPLA